MNKKTNLDNKKIKEEILNLKKNLSESKYNSILKKNKNSQIYLSETITTPYQIDSNSKKCF